MMSLFPTLVLFGFWFQQWGAWELNVFLSDAVSLETTPDLSAPPSPPDVPQTLGALNFGLFVFDDKAVGAAMMGTSQPSGTSLHGPLTQPRPNIVSEFRRLLQSISG